MEYHNRKSVIDKLSKYSIYSNGSDDYIEITEWINGEGWDICLGNKRISLSFEELDAINFLTKALDINNIENNKK